MYTRAKNMLFSVSKQIVNRSPPIIKNPIMKINIPAPKKEINKL